VRSRREHAKRRDPILGASPGVTCGSPAVENRGDPALERCLAHRHAAKEFGELAAPLHRPGPGHPDPFDPFPAGCTSSPDASERIPKRVAVV